MDTDVVINDFLIYLRDLEPGWGDAEEFLYEKYEIDPTDAYMYIPHIKDSGLFVKRKEAEYFSLSKFGRNVLDNHTDWLGYKKEIDKEIKEKKARQELEDGKLIHESKLAKWQVKSFWWVFFIGLFGGICGIIALAIDIYKYFN